MFVRAHTHTFDEASKHDRAVGDRFVADLRALPPKKFSEHRAILLTFRQSGIRRVN